MQYNFLQVVISSPLIHALGNPNQAPETWIRIERQTIYQLSYPYPLVKIT